MENECLVYLVACAANEIAPDAELVAEMDLEAVYRVAARHMLAATVAPALKAAGVPDERFTRALERSVRSNIIMDAEMRAVFAKLDAAGIWHMPLKGVVVQHLYPAYGMRQMSDRDVCLTPHVQVTFGRSWRGWASPPSTSASATTTCTTRRP